MSDFGFTIERSADQPDWRPVFTDIAGLVEQYGFVLIRGFDISDEEHQEIADSLGTPIQYGFGRRLNMKPREGTQESQFTNRSMALHQDTILNEGDKAHYLVFKCHETPQPGKGGETLLTNNRMFLQVIPAELKERLKKSVVEYTAKFGGYYQGQADDGKPVLQAPIIANPYSGEESLFIGVDDPDDENRNYVSRFSGLTHEESARWMGEIDSYLRTPSVLYAHQWQVGDILILDNFHVCHGRNSFHLGEPRHLVRVSVA